MDGSDWADGWMDARAPNTIRRRRHTTLCRGIGHSHARRGRQPVDGRWMDGWMDGCDWADGWMDAGAPNTICRRRQTALYFKEGEEAPTRAAPGTLWMDGWMDGTGRTDGWMPWRQTRFAGGDKLHFKEDEGAPPRAAPGNLWMDGWMEARAPNTIRQRRHTTL